MTIEYVEYTDCFDKMADAFPYTGRLAIKYCPSTTSHLFDHLHSFVND